MVTENSMNAFLIAGLLTGVDPTLLSAICYVESKHDAGAYVAMDGNSPSYGICQIKLATARFMGFKGTAEQLMEPATNIYYAARYMAYQKRRYNDRKKALSAYNAGRAIESNKATYVRKVMRRYQDTKPILVGAL